MTSTNEVVWRNLPGCITVSVGGTVIAGAANVHQGTDKTPEWHVTPAGIRARIEGTSSEMRTFVANDEEHARDWLLFLAGLYMAQPVAA